MMVLKTEMVVAEVAAGEKPTNPGGGRRQSLKEAELLPFSMAALIASERSSDTFNMLIGDWDWEKFVLTLGGSCRIRAKFNQFHKLGFGGTPFRKSIESPSAWKSPWFINTFLSSPRIDTEITIEDFGYFMSPGDRSYDAIGLMKQINEQTAAQYASAHEILGNETPKALPKGKSRNDGDEDREDIDPNNQRGDCSQSASSALMERRVLDFSECGTPVKGDSSKSSAMSFSSPTSYLLKGCR